MAQAYGGDDHGPVPTRRRLVDYRRERFTMDDAYVGAVIPGSCTCYGGAGSTAITASQLVPVPPERRTPTSRSSTSTWTIRSPSSDTRSRRRRAQVYGRDRPARDHPRGRCRRRPPAGRALPVSSARTRSCPMSNAASPRRGRAGRSQFGTVHQRSPPAHHPIDFGIGRAHGLPEPVVDRPGWADERRRSGASPG